MRAIRKYLCSFILTSAILTVLAACGANDQTTVPQAESPQTPTEYPATSMRQGYINNALAIGRSEIIVGASPLIVSRNAIAFGFENLSNEIFIYGEHFELARYYDCNWQYVHTILEDEEIFFIDTAYGIEPNEVLQDTVALSWAFGTLEPGRHMFIRSFWPDASPPTEQNIEYLLIEFFIEEDTPYEIE